MNIWMDIAIPALVFAAGCLAVAIWALWDRGQVKTHFEDVREDYDACTIARNSFKIDLEACQKECKRLSDYSVELLNAKVRHEHEALTLRRQLEEIADAYGKLEAEHSSLELGHKLILAELDASSKPKETAPKPKRNSRAKPPATQE